MDTIIAQKLDKLAECGWSRNSTVVLCSEGNLRKLDVGTENTTYTQRMAAHAKQANLDKQKREDDGNRKGVATMKDRKIKLESPKFLKMKRNEAQQLK